MDTGYKNSGTQGNIVLGGSDPTYGNWVNPTNAATLNSVYATTANLFSGRYSNYLAVTNFDFSAIPDGANIDGIQVEVNKKVSSQWYCDKSVKLIDATGAIAGDDRATADLWSTVDTYSYYGGAADKWGLTPSSADVKDSNWGVGIAVTHTGSSCFVKGTKIQTINGLVAIERIKKGDTVVSFKGNKLKLSKVLNVIRAVTKKTVTINGKITASEGHPFKTDKGFKRVEKLKLGDTVFTLKGGELIAIKVRSIKIKEGKVKVYNLTVEGNTYLANGFAVHNKGSKISVDHIAMKVYYSVPAPHIRIQNAGNLINKLLNE